MRKNFTLLSAFFLALFFCGNSVSLLAQNKEHDHTHNHNHSHEVPVKPGKQKILDYLKDIPRDGDSLKGFDIKWVMEKAAKQGVKREELSRYIELRKRRFINLKYGIEETDFHSHARAINPYPVVNAPCTNMGFEDGTINGWTLTSGSNSNSVTQAGCCPNAGGQTTIMTGAGTDGCGGFPVVAPGGGNNSVMIGNGPVYGYDVNQLSQTFQVTSNNQILTVQYAVVLEDGGHSATDQPYFNMQVLDGSGNLLPCGNYNVIAGSGGVGGWQASGACANVSYLSWQTVSFDLSSIPIGGSVEVEFTCSDCAQGGHYGYAYVDAFCGTTQIQSSNPCASGTQQLCAPPGMASYNWSGPGVTGQTTQCVTASATGTYSCSTTQAGGCTIPVLTYNLGAASGAVAAFTANPTPCSMTMNFTDNTNLNGATIQNYHWDFGVGALTNDTSNLQSPSYLYTTAGTYTVTQTVTSVGGCVSTFTTAINVASAPTAIFTTPADICNGTASVFTNTSTTPAGTNITAYAWDFTNDGTTDNTTASPTFTYPAPGTYTAELTITNDGGCSNTTTQTIVVHDIPVPSFTATSPCQGVATTFTNGTTINAPSTVASWAWDFTNDGTTDDATQNPTFTFPAAGTFTTELTATGEAPTACTATYTLAVVVNPNPTSNFSNTTVCVGNGTAFTNLATVAAPDNIVSNTWNFGDGGSSTTASPSHQYAACGTYNTILTVITNNGCNATFNANVTVNCGPVAAFTGTNVCLNTASAFTDNSNVSGSTISNWAWDFDNNGTVDNTTQNPSFTYASDGTYTVSLIVYGANGCIDTIDNPVTVYPNPQVAFVSVNACDQSATSFTNQTIINAPDVINTWAWDFDSNGSTESALQTPSYVFPGGPGTYNVTLTATSNNSCVSSATIPVTVYPNPVASFTASTVCQGTASGFTDASTVTGAGNNIAQWNWDFDNNGTTDNTTQNPNNLYASFGASTAELVVVTNNGCSDSVTVTVNVNPNPVPSFSVTSVCLGLSNAYTDLSTVNAFGGSTITGWAWDFTNDGTQDNATANPGNVFTSAGTFNTELTVTTSNGCVGTVTLPATVYPLPVASFSSDPSCANAPIQFTDLSTVAAPSAVNAWSWDLTGDGVADATTQNPSNTYATAGPVTVTLIVTTNSGCKDTVVLNTTVNPNPVVSFSGDVLSGCPVHCVNFTDASTLATGNIVQWSWNFGNGTSALQNPSNCFDNTDNLNPALFSISLTVVSDSGCTNSLTLNNYITVYPEPVAAFSFGPSNPAPTVTDPNVNFVDESIGATSWSWDFGDIFNPGGTSTQQNPSYIYNYSDPYTYTTVLAVANSYGCVDTTDLPVPIGPEFTFYIPNAFTPNGDNVNEGFRGYGIGIEKYTMWIYDRWGNLIFTADELTKKWDGKVQGKSDNIVQEDVYVWKVKLLDVFGRNHSYVGHVTVVK